MEDVQVLGVSKSNDGKQAQYWATDPKAGYTLVSPNAEDYNPAQVEWVSSDHVDYNLVAPESFETKPGGHAGLPISYLQISTVEAGAEWYKANTRYPDEVCEMMAKYEWGDLRHTTKKEFKNMKKRSTKRAKKPKSLVVKRGPILVHFDD